MVPSLLDTDWYKIEMGQLILAHWPNINVRWELMCRNAPLSAVLDDVDVLGELDDIARRALTADEAFWLEQQGVDSKYIDFLEDGLHANVEYGIDDGRLFVEGPWPSSSLWEIYVLSTLTEHYEQRRGSSQQHLASRFLDKIQFLNERHPSVRVAEFGTRRRYSRETQQWIVQTLKFAAPDNLIGTSNVHLARTLDIAPTGTYAHELQMVLTAHLGHIEPASRLVWETWREDHEPPYIVLADTFTTEWFTKVFPQHENVQDWSAVRIDSGNPVWQGDALLEMYQEHDVAKPLLLFSDSIDVYSTRALDQIFQDRAHVAFGIGTNLTNDTGLENLNLVMKPTLADGVPCVKLSDEPGKATGDPERVTEIRQQVAEAL